MKYIKLFESLIDKDDYKNKILLIDASASFQIELEKILKTELYLSNKFTALFCSFNNVDPYENIDIEDLFLIIEKFHCSGGDGIQDGVDYIIDNKLNGAVLIFSDGYFELNISKLENDISVLSTESKPIIVGGECEIFFRNIDTTDYYCPRDCKSMEEYGYRKDIKKYNL